MTGPENYRAAEALAEQAIAVMDYEHGIYSSMSTDERLKRQAAFLAEAQVRATLSLAAATALGNLVNGGPLEADRTAWVAAASEHPGQRRRIREAEAAELAEYAKEPQS